MACNGMFSTCPFEVSLVQYEGLRMTQKMQMFSAACMPKRYILASGNSPSFSFFFTLDPCIVAQLEIVMFSFFHALNIQVLHS